VDRHDGADSEDGVDVRVGAGHWMVGGRRAARSGAVVLATPPACRLKSPHALRVPAYRLALRVGSVPTPRVIMQAVFPWRQGTPCGDMIASVTFSQPERLRHGEFVVTPGTVVMLKFSSELHGYSLPSSRDMERGRSLSRVDDW
jgi:hypothetical protein